MKITGICAEGMPANTTRSVYIIGQLVSSLILISMLAYAQQPDAENEGPLHFRFVGPKSGNRVSAIAGIPGDPTTYYAGAASGGVWKSTDGGNGWKPIFDKQPAAAIGALAVAPSDPSTVWAGTGEAWAIRDIDVMGNGIYKSIDGGKTWTNMGLGAWAAESDASSIHPSNSRHRIRLRPWPHDWATARPRHIPDDRRRTALGASPFRRRKCGLLRTDDGSP